MAQVKNCHECVKWMLSPPRKMPKDFSLLGFTNLKSYAIILYAVKRYAPVAQLDRALDSDSKGRWFDSSRAYQEASAVMSRCFFVSLRSLLRKVTATRAPSACFLIVFPI